MGSMAEKISTRWPAHCHVIYHVHIVEFKELPKYPYQQILWSELIEPNLPRKEHVIEGRALAFIAFLYHSPLSKSKDASIPFGSPRVPSAFRNRIGDFLQTE